MRNYAWLKPFLTPRCIVGLSGLFHIYLHDFVVCLEYYFNIVSSIFSQPLICLHIYIYVCLYVWFIATSSENYQDRDSSGDINNGDNNGDRSGDRYVYDVNGNNINDGNEVENKTDSISNSNDTITTNTTSSSTVSSSSLYLQPLSSELR